MVLVSIVGDFDSSVLPIVYEFKDDISKHILIYDDFKYDVIKAQNIKKGLSRFKKKYNYDFELKEYKIDEDSLQNISDASEFLLLECKDASDIFINTTDGLSSVAAILNYKLIKKGVNFISYDMYDNQYNILNKKSLQKFSICNNLNIQDHFLLKGFGIETSNIAKFAKKYQAQIKEIFEKYSEAYDAFTKLPAGNKSISTLSNDYKKIKNIFTSMKQENTKIKDPLLTGTLFEAYIYNLLSSLDFDDIEIGLKVSRKYKNSKIVNEFDVLIMKDNHLHMIECKYKNNIKLEELIYKYIALSDIIDEDGKMIIVTKKPHQYDSNIDNNEHGGKVYKRAKLSNITMLGAVHKDSVRFISNVKGIFNL
nr:DUF1887 family CARF protein [uncultured Sulfurimonas sp.]